MAWGDKKEMLVAENAAKTREIELLREQITDLKTDREDLKTQLRYTQDAIIAKESPEAYRDKMDAEEAAKVEPLTEEQVSQRNLQSQKAEITQNYFNAMEGELFKDAADMISLLTPAAGVPLQEDHSLHGNDES